MDMFFYSFLVLNISYLLIKLFNKLRYILVIMFLLFCYIFTLKNIDFVKINIMLVIIYIIVIIKYLIIKYRYNKVSNEYCNIVNSFNEYESMIDKYRILNHENKNQLLTIRSMIVKKEENIPMYIDTLIDTTINDNEKLMFETNIIPSGGLRAIIYSKMAYMKDINIKPILDVERSIRKIDLTNINNNLMVNICKIIGVFLDNAIEEVEKLDKKEIKIKLYIKNNNLCITIKNKFLKDFNLNKIGICGYTTKGNNHGYGLSLVKKIISENSNIINNKYIENNYFVQNLEIVGII